MESSCARAVEGTMTSAVAISDSLQNGVGPAALRAPPRTSAIPTTTISAPKGTKARGYLPRKIHRRLNIRIRSRKRRRNSWLLNFLRAVFLFHSKCLVFLRCGRLTLPPNGPITELFNVKFAFPCCLRYLRVEPTYRNQRWQRPVRANFAMINSSCDLFPDGLGSHQSQNPNMGLSGVISGPGVLAVLRFWAS